MRITLVTGIYPPEIGGPAEYAKNLKDIWASEGHKVDVKIFGKFQWIPWGLRHVVFMFYIIPSVLMSDCVFTLDAFSSGVVLVVGKIFSKKVVFRTGGDALWEGYVERTGKLVLLSNFYKTEINNLNSKERIMFQLMRWTLKNLSAVIWSTEWQRDIFMEPYELQNQKHFIVENYYGPKLESTLPTEYNFVATTRELKWKNLKVLNEVFGEDEIKKLNAHLDTRPFVHSDFLEHIGKSFAVIIVSLGDVSPNTILDAIRCNKPFIVTKETGLYERIKEVAVFVDPENSQDIKEKVLWLCNEANYQMQKRKLEEFTFTHTWEEIAQEYLNIYKKV